MNDKLPQALFHPIIASKNSENLLRERSPPGVKSTVGIL